MVAGATGFLGGKISQHLLDSGMHVVAVGRSQARYTVLRSRSGADYSRLRFLPWGTPQEMQSSLERVAPQAQAVVAALGGLSVGPSLLDTSPAEWSEIIHSHLTVHLHAMQAFAPVISRQDNAVYVTLNGEARRRPLPGSGAVCIAGAGQHMLNAMMNAEPVGQRVRFCELSVSSGIAEDDRNGPAIGYANLGSVLNMVSSIIAGSVALESVTL